MQRSRLATGAPIAVRAEHRAGNVIDGVLLTAAAELPSEAYDLTKDQPVFEPITRYRLAGRRIGGSAVCSAGVDTSAADAWHEALRRALAKPHPRLDVLKRYVCRQGHTLLYLVRSPWGAVPVARTADGRYAWRGSGAPDGSPMNLAEWPAGEHLPIASCACHKRVEVGVYEARSWMEVQRDKFVRNR